jgi:riboflavin kinase/FMN adenylyltransferase
MKIFNSIQEIENISPSVIALGNFDGVHRGHIELIKRAVTDAMDTELCSAVFTFSNHPRNFLAGKNVIKNIITSEDKISIIEELGVDYIFNIPFDEHIHVMEPVNFINDLILDKMNSNILYCGFNYHYGKNASGSTESLIGTAEAEGFEVNVLEPYIVDGNLVSSTLIRSLIGDGKIDECTKYLGRHYYTRGTVEVGNRIGRTIGFPTTNIGIDDSMVWPSHGVYITNCYYDGVKYPAVTNVGIRPTIGDNRRVVETHMFNFNQSIYEQEIKVEFIKKIRDEVKFKDKDELKMRIGKDKQTAEDYHKMLKER